MSKKHQNNQSKPQQGAMPPKKVYPDMQVLLENAAVGKSFAAPLKIDGRDAAEVTVHCSEVMNDGHHKVFAVFSHGVQISEVKATKEAGKWVPR